jgi:hypothetical protein
VAGEQGERPDGRLISLSLQQMQEFTGSMCFNLPVNQEYIVVHKDKAARIFNQWRDRI